VTILGGYSTEKIIEEGIRNRGSNRVCIYYFLLCPMAWFDIADYREESLPHDEVLYSSYHDYC
jgi:hypothetical protein